MTKLSKHLCQAVQDSLAGKPVKALDGSAPIWNAFRSLSATRTYSMGGADPLQPMQIEAYCRMMGLPLRPHHIQTILDMDQVWLGHARTDPKDKRQVSSQPLTGNLFDAMFGG